MPMSQETRLATIEIHLREIDDQLTVKYSELDNCNYDDERKQIRADIKNLNISRSATKDALDSNEWYMEFVPRTL